MLGQNTGNVPRHAKRYADFTAEFAELQRKRIEEMLAFGDEVRAGAYPSAPYVVQANQDVVDQFADWLEANS